MTSSPYVGPPDLMAQVSALAEPSLGLDRLAGMFAFAIRPGAAGVLASAALWRRLGVADPAAMTVAAFLDHVHPEDRSGLRAWLAVAAVDDSEADLCLRLRVAEGDDCRFILRGLRLGAQDFSGALIEQTAGQNAALGADNTQPPIPEFAAIADAMPQMVWSTRPDGFHDYYNAGWYDFTGMPPGSTDGAGWNGMFHPDDQARAWKLWSHALATGEPYEIEYRLRHHSGDYRWVLGRARSIRDAKGQIVRWFGTCTDIHDTKKAAEYVELLSQELSHRIKNIFAIVQSLIGLSGRRAPESAAFARDLQARIAALGRAHDLARPHSDQSRPHHGGVTLHGLAREILRPYIAMDDGRITISGADVAVDDAAATPFALILHELATNAKKYGALSTETGRVDISSACEDGECRLIWTETGGPGIAAAPTSTGFGTKLMLASAQSHLNGKIDWHWNSDGLNVTVTCPRSSLLRAAYVPHIPAT